MEIQWKSCRGPISFPVVVNWAKYQILIFAGGFFSKELFENIDAESETGESLKKAESEPKSSESEPKLSQVRK